MPRANSSGLLLWGSSFGRFAAFGSSPGPVPSVAREGATERNAKPGMTFRHIGLRVSAG